MDQVERYQIEEHVPGTGLITLYFIVITGLIVAGLLVSFYYPWEENRFTPGWFWILGLLSLGLIGPLAIQRYALKCFEVVPHRKTWGGKSFLTYWWSAEGHKFDRDQFLVVYGMPAFYICALVIAYATLVPQAAPIVGFVFAGYAGNVWFSAVALSKRKGTLVEEFDRGIRFHKPPE